MQARNCPCRNPLFLPVTKLNVRVPACVSRGHFTINWVPLWDRLDAMKRKKKRMGFLEPMEYLWIPSDSPSLWSWHEALPFLPSFLSLMPLLLWNRAWGRCDLEGIEWEGHGWMIGLELGRGLRGDLPIKHEVMCTSGLHITVKVGIGNDVLV